MTTINDYLIDDILNLIFSMSNNYYCTIVCKKWHNIISTHSDICTVCNKIVQVYKGIIWVNDPESDTCHSFHVRRFKILSEIIARYNLENNK